MVVTSFIARRVNFKGNLATVSITVSFLVMIIAVAISSGFRKEIRDGISSMSGDVQITSSDMNWVGETSPIERTPAYLTRLESLRNVETIVPAVYRAGIVKVGDNIHGVLFKGIDTDTTLTSLRVSVPDRLSSVLGISEGDALTAYFIGEKVKVRKFRVNSVYNSLLDSDENLIVYASLEDMQRLNGWDEESVSALEVRLNSSSADPQAIVDAAEEIGAITLLCSDPDSPSVVATSSPARWPQLFDWLNLIDFNVLFILILMTVVAGFNMISGLLIILFENIPMIGTLKSMGMKDRAIAKVFLKSSSSLVLKGMAIGNALALIFCLIQGTTHFIKLDPSNYFVSHVPVHLDLLLILGADAVAYVVIMVLLLIPSLFIAGVDPAKTVRVG